MQENVLEMLKEKYHALPKGKRTIADYVLEHYDKAAYMTAVRLAGETNVSPATVIRLAAELGFQGYPEFQRALQHVARNNLTSVQRVQVTNQLIGDKDILDQVLLADAERIKQTLESVDKKSFDGAVDHILQARTIYIIGVRSCASLAGFLNYNLRMISDNVKLIQTTSGSELFEQMLPIGREDVMIAISFPRYSARVINAASFAREAGANVVALTDSPTAPLAAFADELLVAESDMASFVDSLVAPLSIINAIIVALSLKRQTEVSDRLRRLEEIWDAYDVYAKGKK